MDVLLADFRVFKQNLLRLFFFMVLLEGFLAILCTKDSNLHRREAALSTKRTALRKKRKIRRKIRDGHT